MNRENHIEKDLQGNYLWVNREGVSGEHFEEMILKEEKIQGLMPFYEIESAGETYLVYRLEFRKDFLQMLDGARMQCEQIEELIKAFIKCMEIVDEYLLDPSNLVMEMDYIFEENGEWRFIYIPGYQQDFWKQMEKLSETWLNYVDYSDERAVLWAYQFYDKVHGNGCSIENLGEILALEKNMFFPMEIAMIQESEKTEYTTTKEKKSMWHRFKKKSKKRSMKGRKSKKDRGEEVSEFFGRENSLEDTCPMLEMTADFGTDGEKTLTLIPMGDTSVPVKRIEKMPSLIGRALNEVDVCIEDARISRIHARMDYKNGQVVLVDMNSINGTYRNGERLKAGEPYGIHAGDIIKLADLEFICQWCA